MADSVNLNPFVSSSIIDYKKFIEAKSTGEAKNYASSAANVTYDSEDEESGLIEEQTAVPVSGDLEEKVETSANNLLNSLKIDIELHFAFESGQLSDVDWENDPRVKELQAEYENVTGQLPSLIEKYQEEFLESYTGDGTNIEADFVAFLETKSDYTAIYEKYNQSELYDYLSNYQNTIDDLTNQIEELEKSGKTDDETQYQISKLENWRQITENRMSSIKQSQQYRQAAEGK